MNLKESFSYLKNGEKWYINFLIGSVIVLLILGDSFYSSVHQSFLPVSKGYEVTMFIVNCVVIFLSIILNGYDISNTHNLIHTETNQCLSWKSFNHILKSGFVAIGAYILYYLPIMLLGIFFIYILYARHTEIGMIMSIVSLLTPFVIAILLLFNLIITCSFVTDLKFISFFQYKKMYELIKNNKKGFLILLLFTAVFAGINQLCFVTIKTFPYLLLPLAAVVSFYLLLVKSSIMATFVKQSTETISE